MKRKARAPLSEAECATRAARKLLDEAIRRISFKHAPIPTVVHISDDRFCVSVHVRHRDRKRKTMTWVRFSWQLPVALMSREHALDWIYAYVREVWVHELNEWLCVDGKRRHDLHDADGHALEPPGERTNLAVLKHDIFALLMAAK